MPLLEHEIALLVDAQKMKRVSGEWKGGCPRCGGQDRFHCNDGGLVGCRQCGSERGFYAAVKNVIESRQRELQGKDPAAVRTSLVIKARGGNAMTALAGRIDGPKAPTLAVASAMWRNAELPEGTPALAYLADRKAWPPNDMPLPKSVRWVPAQVMRDAGCKKVPEWAAGAIAFRYEDGEGKGTAVAVEALDADGKRPAKRDDRWRRAYGSRVTSKFIARLGPEVAVGASTLDAFKASMPDELGHEDCVVVCEGEVTALAAALSRPGAKVLASGGTANLSRAVDFAVQAADAAHGADVILEVDGDEAGRKAAAKIIEEHPSVTRSDSPEGKDVADVLRERVEDALTKAGGDLTAAWNVVLAESRKGQERPSGARGGAPLSRD